MFLSRLNENNGGCEKIPTTQNSLIRSDEGVTLRSKR